MNLPVDLYAFFRDSLLMIVAWFFMAAAFFSWGVFLSKILEISISGNRGVIAKIWLGWFFNLVFFAFYHLFFPINAFASCVFYLSGIVFFVFKYAKKLVGYLKSIERLKLAVIFFMILCVSAVAVQLPLNYDTGLYHLNAIRWANEHHIIKGLGNLHTRLGFNQLYFLYAASLNFHPYLSAYGYHAANTFLFVLFAVGLFLSGKALDFLLIGLFYFLPMPYFWIVSPTTDIASSLLQVIAFRYFIDGIYFNQKDKEKASLIAFVAVAAAILVTIKLSNGIFALGLGLTTLLLSKNNPFEGFEKQILGKTFVFIGIFLCLWIGRGYVQTGYPLFPSSVGRIDFDWTVPERLAKYTENYVYAGSRTDGLITNIDAKVLKGWAWLKEWFETSFFSPDYHLSEDLLTNICSCLLLVFFPMTMFSWGIGSLTLLVSSLLLLLLWLVAIIRQKELLTGSKELFCLVLVESASILFWFFVAPEVRFANSLFVLLFVTSLLLVKEAYPNKLRASVALKRVMMFYPVVILAWCFWLNYSMDEFMINGIITLKPVKMAEFATSSGLIIKVPANGSQSWDSALIITPEPDVGLALRTSDLADGFCIKE